MEFLLGWWKCSGISGDGCTTLTILLAIEMYTLNYWMLWYVNNILIKLFQKLHMLNITCYIRHDNQYSVIIYVSHIYYVLLIIYYINAYVIMVYKW